MAHPKNKLSPPARCTSCLASKETNGLHQTFDSLKCKYCTARLIRTLGKLPIPQTEAKQRRKAVLADSLERGMSELEIRALVKDGPWLEPA